MDRDSRLEGFNQGREIEDLRDKLKEKSSASVVKEKNIQLQEELKERDALGEKIKAFE